MHKIYWGHFLLLIFFSIVSAPSVFAADSSGDGVLHLSKDVIARLEELKDEPKFYADSKGFYTGIHDNVERVHAENVVNNLIKNIENGINQHPTKDFVLKQFSMALNRFGILDTEDREKAVSYLERIMDILNLESSDGLLNQWMYGFNPAASHQ